MVKKITRLCADDALQTCIVRTLRRMEPSSIQDFKRKTLPQVTQKAPARESMYDARLPMLLKWEQK
jgi:hypothetical protein